MAALLAGAELPPGAAPELGPLAQALAGLRGQPARDELAGEAETLAVFRSQFAAPGSAHPPTARKRVRLPWPLTARAAAAATVLGLAGAATAAYAGVLPTAVQRLARDILGAPPPGAQPVTGASLPTTGHSGYGLCTAWAHARERGTHQQQAAAFGKLAAAAGGAGSVTAYCATVPSPGTTPAHLPTVLPTPRGPGRPSAVPTPRGSGRPTAVPTPRGPGKPTAVPTPRGPGEPAVQPIAGHS